MTQANQRPERRHAAHVHHRGTPMTRLLALTAALTALLATGCAATPDQQAAERLDRGQSTETYLRDHVVSYCDEHRNRIYAITGYANTSLAVVPNDPTCQETP